MTAPDTLPATYRQRLRHWIIHWLRPGKNDHELLEVLSRAEAVRSDTQRQMLEHIIDMKETRIREVMTPRSEIIALHTNMTLDTARALMVKHGISRAPLIEHDLDHMLGVIHVWDLFRLQIEHSDAPALIDLASPCMHVAELQRVSGVLQGIKTGVHLAIVQDEYGGVAGLVSLSDMLSEIVGPLNDAQRSGPEESECVLQEDGRYEVLTRMHIEEFEEALQIKLPQGDYDTVGGLIISQLQRIPRQGERVKVSGLDFRILEADPRRVIRVSARHLESSQK
ncbi:MAG: hemolysin family protein [Mariprofundales bacterium]|nr:hemolysin family protein [Mariprofundales bacterium]